MRLIAPILGFPRGPVTIERGATARTKFFGISGITRAEAVARLRR